MKTVLEDKLLKRMLLLSLIGTLLLVTFTLITDYSKLARQPAVEDMALIHQKDSLEEAAQWHLLQWLKTQEIPSFFEWK